jgi:hypothetical protein
MSYIQVEIGGKPRGLKFNQMAVLTMTQYLDYNNMAATYGYALVYSGLLANCYVKREEPDFTFEQACDWADEISVDDLTKIRECFESTQTFKTLTKAGEEQTKKKARSTTKNAIK